VSHITPLIQSSSGLWSKAGHDDHDFSCPFLMVSFYQLFFFFFTSFMLVVFSGLQHSWRLSSIDRFLPFHWFGTFFPFSIAGYTRRYEQWR
jgi:hypothetical protein